MNLNAEHILAGALFQKRALEIVAPLTTPQLGCLLREIVEQIKSRATAAGEPPLTSAMILDELADLLRLVEGAEGSP